MTHRWKKLPLALVLMGWLCVPNALFADTFHVYVVYLLQINAHLRQIGISLAINIDEFASEAEREGICGIIRRAWEFFPVCNEIYKNCMGL